MTSYLITTLAEYQTAFWLPVGLRLRELGHVVAYISFDDRSTDMLQNAGLRVYSATDFTDVPAGDHSAVDALFTRFGLTNLNFWCSHERFAFGMRDAMAMRRKLAAALLATDRACAELGRESVVMVQELGGFLSVIGSFFAARSRGIDNWFIEPSFYRGRMMFLRNSFAAATVTDPSTDPVPSEVSKYLEDTIKAGAIVVPIKDRHQYTTARKKIVNWRNFRRLSQKLIDKHIYGKKQEFGHIGSHVQTHARMLKNSYRLRHSYKPLEEMGPFVYYPLHVPGDMALTLRTPHYLDQLALIDFICRSVPWGYQVVIKEHPAMVGAVDADRIFELLRRYDNLRLLPPSTNNYKVLAAARAVVSVNSKTGAEAGLVGKPVIVLGDAFYRKSPIAVPVERLQDLPDAIARVLDPQFSVASPDVVQRYFAAVWQKTYPGELYVSDAANIAVFTNSLIAATTGTKA
jgi:Capsule polysaccharide biosynthesis protein